MEKMKIQKDSPIAGDSTAHLQPVIDFLIEQGNIPHSKKFEWDRAGIGTYMFYGPINPDLLKQKFEFPESIKVGIDDYYSGGVIWDERNALKIHRGVR